MQFAADALCELQGREPSRAWRAAGASYPAFPVVVRLAFGWGKLGISYSGRSAVARQPEPGVPLPASSRRRDASRLGLVLHG